jgi:hypothetical protein
MIARRSLWLGLLLTTILNTSEASDMLFVKTIFSAVNGVVLKDGKPAVGASVRQIFNFSWASERGEVRTVTDDNGRFSFPKISRLAIAASIFPHEPVIGQTITITHDGKEYDAWMLTKHNYDENGELKGRPLNITCELTREKTLDEATSVYGICNY